MGERLRALGQADGLSETEKQERMQASVRSLFSDIFSTNARDMTVSKGKAAVQEAQKIVEEYIGQAGQGELYKKIKDVIGNTSGTYNHASNVSVYASLFSMATGVGKPEELASAGMLHDLGLTELPKEVADKHWDDMDFGEKSIYEEHPAITIRRVKEQKLVISPEIEKAILQHHERFHGRGFPKKYQGKQVTPEAQILGLADEFDYLTRIKKGKKSFSSSRGP